ncbi:baseplate J/gp47 family protein [Burkholderia cepacia]|uniref:baseplate J/gp47 family protein n=1 Tax=Burkholderia cepacia TaxID=292 RepID=UPI002ABDFAA2|nr:baseplate J/gp47 family protein [Burkholderia cepacia]
MSTSVQVAIPTIAELKDNAARQLQQGLTDAAIARGGELSVTDIELARSNIEVQAFVQGVSIHGAYRYLRDFIARQAIPTKSVDEFLNDWLIAYGLPRKEAIVSQGEVIGSGVAGMPLAGGSILSYGADLTFTVLEDARAGDDGAITAKVVCDIPGRAGNLAADTALELIATVPGIDSTFKVGTDGLGGGTDRETDSEAIYRLGQRLANPPRGSAPADYERWALSVPGITRAWGIRNPAGPTTAGVIIMADNNEPYGLPTQAQKKAVYDYIREPKRGPPDELFVIVPDPVFVDVVLKITPDTAAIRDSVRLELRDLFYREAVPHGGIPHTHLSEAVSAAAGEFDHVFLQPELKPGGMLIAGAFEMLILRSVEFR